MFCSISGEEALGGVGALTVLSDARSSRELSGSFQKKVGQVDLQRPISFPYIAHSLSRIQIRLQLLSALSLRGRNGRREDLLENLVHPRRAHSR